MIKRRLFSTLTVFLFVFISVTFLIPSDLNAETREFWVDTSHWETNNVWVSEGHFQDTQEKRWVDTSYTVTQGYWENSTKNVWVSSGYTASRWVDTSHYETRYRYVDKWIPTSATFSSGSRWVLYVGYPYSVGYYVGTINGTRYKYKKTVYFPYWVTSTATYTLYECYQKLVTVLESYSVWVSSGYTSYYWVDTSHYETRYRDVWVTSGYSQSYWVDTSHWETQTGKRWVDTSYTVTQGYWENYTTSTWVNTSHWETNNVWVSEGHWVDADLDPYGKVLHTEQWNLNRINYNLSKTGDPDKPRGYEIFFNGEKFVLECDSPGDFQPESVHVEFLGTGFETDLTKTGDSKWEGSIWDKSFIYFHDRDCVFKFTASYDYNGDKFDLDDEVTVYIVRDYYWELHRGF